MALTKREVWEVAKQTGCDVFIAAVSKEFGKDAISEVCIEHDGYVDSTCDRFAQYNPVRVSPGSSLSGRESKEIRSAKK